MRFIFGPRVHVPSRVKGGDGLYWRDNWGGGGGGGEWATPIAILKVSEGLTETDLYIAGVYIKIGNLHYAYIVYSTCSLNKIHHVAFI